MNLAYCMPRAYALNYNHNYNLWSIFRRINQFNSIHYFRDFGPGFLLFVTDTGINHFRDTFELTTGYCYNLSLAIATCDSDLEDGAPGCQRVLDPDADCPDFLRLPPFSTCKNDCPGGEHWMLQKKTSTLFLCSEELRHHRRWSSSFRRISICWPDYTGSWLVDCKIWNIFAYFLSS